jgi:hypothetical protein
VRVYGPVLRVGPKKAYFTDRSQCDLTHDGNEGIVEAHEVTGSGGPYISQGATGGAAGDETSCIAASSRLCWVNAQPRANATAKGAICLALSAIREMASRRRSRQGSKDDRSVVSLELRFGF